MLVEPPPGALVVGIAGTVGPHLSWRALHHRLVSSFETRPEQVQDLAPGTVVCFVGDEGTYLEITHGELTLAAASELLTP